MRFSTWCAGLLGLALLLIMSAGSAQAQATRTWVSGVGDDANPCSRTAPCKTFAGAISKTAAAGEINCLDPGGFGAVTITKSISIICETGTAGVLVSGTNGIVVSAGVGDIVYLKGLDFEGLNTGINGISFIGGKSLHVEKCLIRGFATDGINFAPGNANATLVVQDSVVADNPGGGILIKPTGAFTAMATITNTNSSNNIFGVRAEDRSKVTVFNTTASGNSGNGYVAVSASAAAEINVINSVASNTTTNGIATAGANATIRITNTAILDNTNGINTAGGGSVSGTSPGTNTNSGNTTPGAPNGPATLLQ